MGKWKMVRLGDVCEILDSQRIPITASERKAGNYPYYGANGVQDYVSDYIFDDELVLLAEDGGNFGSKERPIAYRVSGKCWVNNHAHVLKAKQCLDIDYLCKSIMFYDVSKLISGTTRAKLNQAAMRKMLIPLPPLDEQKRIAKNLDLASEIVKGYKEQLVQLDKLVQSVFYEIFGDPVTNERGWTVQNLKDITSLIQSGNTPKGGKQVYIDSGIMFLRSQNVWRNRIELNDIAYINEVTHKKMSKTSLKHNDILITKTGRFNTENSSLGRAALYSGRDNSANINGHVYLVRLNAGIVHKFVLHILMTDEYREYIRSVCVGGIDKRQINKEHLEEFPIIVPPFSLQTHFAEIATEIEVQKAQVQQALTEAENLFNSLMQEYFE